MADTPTTSNEIYEVEFYPSLDDFIHVAARTNKTAGSSKILTYTTYAFLIVNMILFPAYLWMNDYFFVGLCIFALNMITFVVVLPKLSSASNKVAFSKMYGFREKELAFVRLNDSGLEYSSDEASTFFPWRRMTGFEETEDSLFIYVQAGGFGIRKSGFAYREEMERFKDFALKNIKDKSKMDKGAIPSEGARLIKE